MLAEEALFIGHPVAHVVAYYERQRERRIDRLSRIAMGRAYRRSRQAGE